VVGSGGKGVGALSVGAGGTGVLAGLKREQLRLSSKANTSSVYLIADFELVGIRHLLDGILVVGSQMFSKKDTAGVL
jgi:hypothetical protein